MAKYKKVRLSDIAEQLGISTVSVSKALTGKDGVSPELREKIKRQASEMGYSSKSIVANASTSTGTIGILVPARFLTDKNSFYWTMYNFVATELLQRGFYCIMEMLSAEDETNRNTPQMIAEKRIDGMIILGQVDSDFINYLNSTSFPFVFLDFYNAFLDMDSVVSDNFYDMFLLTSYLIEQGHKDIRFVGTFASTSSIQDRFLGFMKAMLLSKLPVAVEDIINDRNEAGEFIPLELPSPLPTAFVCNSDITARRLISVLQEKGLSVPDDISVVGFDNQNVLPATQPELTTVAVDIAEMARTVVDIILRKMTKRPYKKGRNVIGGKIILRDSVKNILQN